MRLIHEFVNALNNFTVCNSRKIAIPCPEQHDAFKLAAARVACLVGAHDLLVQNAPIEVVLDMFQKMRKADADSRFQALLDDIEALMKALDHASKMQLVEYDASDSGGLHCDIIDEHLHYASPVNGNLHIVIPGKLVILPDPALLPDGQLWEDTCSDSGTTRAFSAQYYAELLVHLDVRLVATCACCGNGPADASAAAFEAAGLACEDGLLPAGGGGGGGGLGGALLRAHDRLLTLMRAARGAVALQCCDAASAGMTGSVVMAVLIKEEGFGAREAEAWLRLTCPWLEIAPIRDL
jgi:hypothetical protein